MEQMIVQYLYSNKKVTLQDIGTFSMSSDVVIPQEADKDTVLPENSIEFEYNARAGVDEGLIDFIVQNSRKIRPLATSDLESYVILNKQFLNIGKPLVIEGLGTLQKTQDGNFAFAQASISHVTTRETPKVVTEKVIERIIFATPPKEKSNGMNKIIILSTIGLIILSLLAYAVYHFISKNNVDVPSEQLSSETAKQENIVPATVQKANDSTIQISKIVTKDSNSFYVVIKEYQDLVIAQKRLEKLSSYGNNLILSTQDSITYKMRMPFKLPLTDTLRMRDSLSKFFQAKAYVELP